MLSLKNTANSFSNTGQYGKNMYNTATEKASSLFSPVQKSFTDTVNLSGSENLFTSTNPESSTSASTSVSVSASVSAWRYLFIFLILIFLCINLVLFLIKPVSAPMSQLYDPLLDLFNTQFQTNFKIGEKNNSNSSTQDSPIIATKKNNNAAVKKLEKVIDTKPVINNIDKQTVDLSPPPIKKYKKLPVIPTADDSTSAIQMNPSSKSGFCYIGEDRGFRNCIEVGEGDVCMSGNIFPSEAICINPNLRE